MASSILAGVVWVSSARDSAVGITATPGCSEDSVVTSSSSTAWAAVPLAMAAQTAEVFWFVPMTVALPTPPRSNATVAAGGLEGWRLPASATPIRSSSSSRVRAFTSSSSCAHLIAAQNPASSSAAVPGGADVEVTATAPLPPSRPHAFDRAGPRPRKQPAAGGNFPRGDPDYRPHELTLPPAEGHVPRKEPAGRDRLVPGAARLIAA